MQPIEVQLFNATVHVRRFTHIAVDVTPTKAHGAVAVLYVATNEGLIKKISVLPYSMETCIIEVWGPLPSTPMTLQYLKETKSLYVGMQSSLLRLVLLQAIYIDKASPNVYSKRILLLNSLGTTGQIERAAI